VWQIVDGVYSFNSDRVAAELDPARGLVNVKVQSSGGAQARLLGPTKQLLGVEIVDAVGLGPHVLVEEGTEPEVVTRQDTIMVSYKPTVSRPVECDVRWRVQPNGIFDLEVSALTPGKWDGLSVRTCSALAAVPIGPLLVLHRPAGSAISYVEMCHPHDGIAVDADGGRIRFHLFGHDLEKGVILRGRVRGLVMARDHDEAIARRAYEQFLHEPPHLA
jgi:hypothetical protein